jgi:hypothetical protein
VAGDCIDRSARCAKEEYPDRPVDGVLVTRETVARCSAEVRDLIYDPGVEVVLTDADVPGSRIRPFAIEGKRALRLLRDRVRTAAATLSQPDGRIREENVLAEPAQAGEQQEASASS